MLTYRNDTDAEVKLKLPPKEGEELPTEKVVKPGETIELTDEEAKYFLQYDLQATKVEPTDEAQTGGTEVAENAADEGANTDATSDAGDDDAKDNNAKDEEVAVAEQKLAEERVALAEERRKLAEEKAEMKFAQLCEAGKAVPAQKEAFMALASRGDEVALAEGKTESVSTLLVSLFENAPEHRLAEENGVDGNGEDEPELTDEEKKVADVFGNSEEDIKNMKKEEN